MRLFIFAALLAVASLSHGAMRTFFISWQAPTQDVNNDEIDGVDLYKIYINDLLVAEVNGNLTSASVRANVNFGQSCIVMSALIIDDDGATYESDLSNRVCVEVARGRPLPPVVLEVR
jgi:hypothetical protein